MTKPFQPPHPDTLIATLDNPPARLYAQLANCPLFATVRILGRVIPDNGARSHWLGWCIDEQRWARGVILKRIPQPVLDWAALHVAEVYPSVAEATGMSPDEIEAVRAEQLAKRAKYKKA